jgi:hypothetical protein
MSSTPAGLLLEHCIPLVGVAAFIALAIWVGVLFSVSWLSGRARWMADGTEVGRLAVALDRRWPIPALFASVGTAFFWLFATPAGPPRGVGLYGLVGAALLLVVMHATVSRRAVQVAGGHSEATKGEGMSRTFLVLSLAAIVALLSFRVVSP